MRVVRWSGWWQTDISKWSKHFLLLVTHTHTLSVYRVSVHFEIDWCAQSIFRDDWVIYISFWQFKNKQFTTKYIVKLHFNLLYDFQLTNWIHFTDYHLNLIQFTQRFFYVLIETTIESKLSSFKYRNQISKSVNLKKKKIRFYFKENIYSISYLISNIYFFNSEILLKVQVSKGEKQNAYWFSFKEKKKMIWIWNRIFISFLF